MPHTGNASELTDADTAGLNAFMLGVMSELRISHLSTTGGEPACQGRGARNRLRVPHVVRGTRRLEPAARL